MSLHLRIKSSFVHFKNDKEKKMTGISVIIPVYNTEKYIVECIESVLANNFKDYEIICVNDGSTDSSLDLIKGLSQKHDCIKVISQANKGQSAARNAAIQAAAGKYLYFLDSDDKISADTLKNLYDYLEKDSLDVLYFSGDSFFDTEELEEQFQQFSTVYLRTGTYEGWSRGLTLLQQLRDQSDYSVSPCIQIVRREFLLENDITFYEGIIHEDNLFSFKVIFHAKRAKCVNDIYFHRRIREASVMTTNKSYKNLLGYYVCFLNVLQYVSEHKFQEEYEPVLNGIIRSLKKNVHSSYYAINAEEREVFYEKLDAGDRMFFKSIILQELETETKLKKELKKTKKQLKELKNSTMLKVGKLITWPFRKAKDLIKKIWRKIHGKSIDYNAGM